MNRSNYLRVIAASFAAVSLLAIPSLVHAQDGKTDKTDKTDKPSHKKHFEPQSEIASKTAKFATIVNSSPAVKKATPATDRATVEKAVGKNVQIVGTVAGIYKPKSNSVVILNFAKDYKSAVSAVLQASNAAKFPDMDSLKGKKILVEGTVSTYHDAPEILLDTPTQVKIIK